MQFNATIELNGFCFFFVKYSTGGVSVPLHLKSVNEVAVVALVDVLMFTQHIRLDLVLWLSNIAHIPLHMSPCWSIAFSPASAYHRDEHTSLKIDKSHIYPFQKTNIEQHMVQNLQFQHLSVSKVASEPWRNLSLRGIVYQHIQHPIYSLTIKKGNPIPYLKKKRTNMTWKSSSVETTAMICSKNHKKKKKIQYCARKDLCEFLNKQNRTEVIFKTRFAYKNQCILKYTVCVWVYIRIYF